MTRVLPKLRDLPRAWFLTATIIGALSIALSASLIVGYITGGAW